MKLDDDLAECAKQRLAVLKKIDDEWGLIGIGTILDNRPIDWPKLPPDVREITTVGIRTVPLPQLITAESARQFELLFDYGNNTQKPLEQLAQESCRIQAVYEGYPPNPATDFDLGRCLALHFYRQLAGLKVWCSVRNMSYLQGKVRLVKADDQDGYVLLSAERMVKMAERQLLRWDYSHAWLECGAFPERHVVTLGGFKHFITPDRVRAVFPEAHVVPEADGLHYSRDVAGGGRATLLAVGTLPQ